MFRVWLDGTRNNRMTEEKKSIDWERIEYDYRAGILSVREISEARGVSHTAVNKKAKQLGWERDLKAKIKAKADALVSKAEVSKEVSSRRVATEKETVDSNAKLLADVRMGHRKDISRFRGLASKMLSELEGVTDNQDLFDELGDLMRSPDDKGQDRRNDLYQRVIDLPSRSKTMKEMSDTLKTLIGLERDAYDIVTASKLEMTGENGGPILTKAVAEMTDAELSAMIND